MKYYRVYTGFNDYIPIDSNEMERAMYAFITGNPVALLNGATTRIDRIVPDFHKAMGWNAAHKLDADDENELISTGVQQSYTNGIGKAKEKIQYLIDTNQTALIGQNVKIPELQRTEAPKLTSGLATKFQV